MMFRLATRNGAQLSPKKNNANTAGRSSRHPVPSLNSNDSQRIIAHLHSRLERDLGELPTYERNACRRTQVPFLLDQRQAKNRNRIRQSCVERKSSERPNES